MKEKIDTHQAPRALGPYSQAVKCNGFIFVSGQLPINPKTGAVIEGDIQLMTAQVIDNLEAILKEGGSSLEKVVQCQVFLTDIKVDFSMMNEVYAKRFNSTIPPARTTVEVSELPLRSRIEIACMAMVS